MRSGFITHEPRTYNKTHNGVQPKQQIHPSNIKKLFFRKIHHKYHHFLPNKRTNHSRKKHTITSTKRKQNKRSRLLALRCVEGVRQNLESQAGFCGRENKKNPGTGEKKRTLPLMMTTMTVVRVRRRRRKSQLAKPTKPFCKLRGKYARFWFFSV